jgi:hypothetical protein
LSADVSEVRAASIIRDDEMRNSSLMIEAARTSETSVNNYFTRQYIPEDSSELHTRRRENLKSHNVKTGSSYRILTTRPAMLT